MRGWEAKFLHWLRVPAEPQPPTGSPGSLRVFRAGRNYLRLRLIVWLGAQAGAVFGVFASLVFIREMEIQIELDRVREERAAATADAPAPDAVEPIVEPAAERGAFHHALYTVSPPWLRELPRRIPPGALVWIKLGEAFGIVGFALQLVGSLGVVLLDFRQRWYMVTDRSLRLRWGIFNVHESTMSFANLQQVAVHQGPLERLLGLWDVEVESAGGGSGNKDEQEKDSLHRCVFHGVENGAEIRDTILARLRRFRETGLGDPDDRHASVPDASAPQPVDQADVVRAARDVLAEVRALRSQL